MKKLHLLSMALLSVAWAQNASLPSGVQFVTTTEGISEYKLENGLQVLLFPDGSKRSITVNTTFLVGSVNENYGETGMAHLLEHMVFKGTPTHPNIPKELTERGAAVQGTNGTTALDRTNYYLTFPASSDNLKWALGLEADRMVNSNIAKKDLDTEFSVVRNEFEAGENNFFNVTYQHLNSIAFDWHNYSNVPIGNRSDIENVPIDRLKAFYQKYYQPDNATLLVAGNFDPNEALNTIAETYGKIAKPSRVLPSVYTVEPTQVGEREFTVRKQGDLQLLLAGYHVPAALHPDFPAVDALTFVLGDTPSGALYNALVPKQKAVETGAWVQAQKYPSLAYFYAVASKDKSLTEAQTEFLNTIEQFAESNITPEQIERYKTRINKQYDDILADPNQLGIVLSEFISLGDWRLFFHARDLSLQVTPEAVQQAAQKYLKPSNRTLGKFIPEDKPNRAEITAAPSVDEVMKSYTPKAATDSGEALDPSPLALEKRVLRSTLPEGQKIAMLPKKTKGQKVSISMNFHWGDKESLKGKKGASFIAPIMMRGNGVYSRQELEDTLSKLKSTISLNSSDDGISVSIDTDRSNMPEVLKILTSVLGNFTSWSEAEFDILKQETLASLDYSKNEPSAVAQRELQRIFSAPNLKQGDVGYVPTLAEEHQQVEELTLTNLKNFFAEFFGSSYGEIAVVGDFDPQEAESQIAQAIYGWKTPVGFTPIIEPYYEVQAEERTLKTPEKPNAMYIVGTTFKMLDSNPDYPAMILADYIMGGGFLNSRFATRLRQQDGVSYGAGTQLQVNTSEENALWLGYAIYAPSNVSKVDAAVKEEIHKAIVSGFTPEEIAGAKAGLLESLNVARTEDATLAGSLARQLFKNRTYAYAANLETKIKALTPEDVQNAFKKYINPSNLVIVKAGDF